MRNVLIHAGILQGEPEMAESYTLDMTADNSMLFSENDGLVEFCLDLGESVRVGEMLARVWSAERSGAAPVDYVAATEGILAARHFPGLIKSGDFLAMIARVEGRG
ncbi:MAG: succinylglutamate desuccinylase/aspartoacylase family protein [Thiolinea sp.]